MNINRRMNKDTETQHIKTASILLHFLLLLTIGVLAGENDGKTGMAFLKVGVDARSAGMGEAYTAVAGDAYATYWNPAGLLAAAESNGGFMHNEWLLDVNAEFGAVQFRRERSSWAFHVYTMNVGGIEVRTTPTESPLEITEGNYLSMGLSYARPFSETLDFGLTVKYLFEKVFVHSARGWAADLGVRYSGLGENITLAGVIQHLGSMNELDRASTKLPTTVRGGASYLLPGAIGSMGLLLAGDVVLPLDESVRFHLGVEGMLWDQLGLRIGYLGGYDSRSVTFGVGIRKSIFHVDYSYSPFDFDLGDVQRFSIYLRI